MEMGERRMQGRRAPGVPLPQQPGLWVQSHVAVPLSPWHTFMPQSQIQMALPPSYTGYSCSLHLHVQLITSPGFNSPSLSPPNQLWCADGTSDIGLGEARALLARVWR